MADDATVNDDPFADFDTEEDSSSDNSSSDSSSGNDNSSYQGGNRGFADEIFTHKISAKFRTFFIDVKESSNGKFLKISEKSRGRKSTIMMDAEDVPEFIRAIQAAEKVL